MIMKNEFQNQLLKEDLFNLNIQRYVKKLKAVGNLIIWGSADSGQIIYKFLEKFNMSAKVKFFADNNKDKWGKKQNDLWVLSPEQVLNEVKNNIDTHIIIGAVHLMDMSLLHN